MKVVVILLLAFSLSGCSWVSWLGTSEEQARLETESSAPTEIPSDLDEPEFVDLMPIPDVVDYRGLTGSPLEVGLPQALSTTFGVDTIVIRRLGEQRWVFVDLPPATIWPQVVLFWEENHLPVTMLDPRNGVLETDWIVGRVGNPDEIYDSLINGTTIRIGEAAMQYKFRARVEPGVRSGSTELYIQQIEKKLGAPGSSNWQAQSDNPELEGKLLSTIAYYLGDRTAEGPSVSLLAAGLRESKASLVTGPDGMVLKYQLDFDRAWATVGAALENARVAVEDLDRTSAVYYVNYSSGHDPDPGFFSRLFGRDGKEAAQDGYKFSVHVEAEDEDVHVTVASTSQTDLSETQNIILRERLLKLIKEYST